MKTQKFNNKVVIITGSSRGIGKATAIAISRQGATVMLNGRNKERLVNVERIIKRLGGKVAFYCCDITKSDCVKK